MNLLRSASLSALFVVSSPALAEEAHPANGSWKVSTPPDKLRSTLDAAIDDVAKEFNFVIREIARYKLQNATKVCSSYSFDVKEAEVHFACDSNTPSVLKRDGSPLHTTNDAGEPITGTMQVTDDGVKITWKGEDGARINDFKIAGEVIQLRATVTGSQLPKPLKWTVDYKQ
jgi:hypothetical protein